MVSIKPRDPKGGGERKRLSRPQTSTKTAMSSLDRTGRLGAVESRHRSLVQAENY